MTRAAVLALLALAACAKPAAQTNAPVLANTAANTAPAAALAPEPKLAKIFTPDILGANVAWLETLTGPAFSSSGADRTYKVGACQVIVGVAKGKIANIGLVGVSPTCNFPIAQYFAGGYDHPVPPIPTFGDIQTGLGGAYASDCLALCGSAADPVVTLTYQGSHADNFNTLYAEVSVVDDPVVAAWQDWSTHLAAKTGQAKLEGGTDGLDDTMQAVAIKDFAAIRPTTVRVGEDLPGG